jgi:hypothetical protein
MLTDARSEFRATLGHKLLRVIKTDDATLGIQNNGGGDNGSKQCAASGFIEARNAGPAELARLTLETGRAKSRHDRRRFAESLPRAGLCAILYIRA